MPARRGLFVRRDTAAGTSPQDARLAQAGLVTAAGPLGVVPGVLSGCVVAGTSGWTYTVGAGHYVTSRSAADGAVIGALDGTTTTETVAGAPASGSRYDLIWVRQRDVDSGDSDSLAVVGVTSGTASGSPAKPTGSVPVGALVLAEARVYADATSTAHANVTITPVAPRVAARGGVIPVANVAQRAAVVAAASPLAGNPLVFLRTDAGAGRELEYTTDGTTFRTVAATYAAQRAGSVNVGSPGTSGGGEVTVTFATPMPTANYAVTITDTNVGAGIGMIFWKARAKTVNGFIARAMPASGATPVVGLVTTFDYVAVATDL